LPAATGPASSAPPLRLVTIPISHYCEKARWALERAGIPYREERHVQVLHMQAALRAGGGRTVPVLVTPEGAIGDSREILAWVDRRSPPELRLFGGSAGERDREGALCARLDDRLGPAARRLAYVRMLPQRELVLAFNNQGVPRWEALAMERAMGLFAVVLRRVLAIDEGVEVEDERIVWEEFDNVAELLGDGRPFLAGERFGAADLTFAALAAAVLMPPSYGVALPQPEQLDEPTSRLLRRAREHPAGRFAMTLYERERER